MSAETTSIMGLFESEEEALAAINDIKEQGWQVQEVHSPIPSDKISAALNRKKSKIGWFTLTGGLTGFITGFSVAIFSSTRWNLIVSGKPIVSWFPFFIIAFELTILFAVFGNVIGLLTQVGLPTKQEDTYDPACSGSVYGVLAGSKPEESEKLKDFLQTRGALSSSIRQTT
ncbi:MAG: DUF3341 domain-containing protein [Deltaproteobacteria bacterium]|jgi:hypothetical protein|nr:DUF3341 domain-containing protein [Deltaproteobacteria bacterium]MBT4266647.1 DUF3341 domain-containing protein [Deltaproteobacteria bacterium]MBT4644734.1 DUF3341 domain-containing protein [Deltaproteobacteria bacterium]MBT6504685.1 DUF3341 domain-containing protein [Deltaproteobacteria bacterium]MBT6615455.1 DUF3341 domain-containing protein [Deltaproteobacteria bacterium]